MPARSGWASPCLSGSRTLVRVFAPARFGWSRCLSVFVDQPAEDVGPFDGLAGILVSDECLACEGWPVVKGSVRPVAVVVRLEFAQDGSELTFMEAQHPVQALAADCADPPFGVGVIPRRQLRLIPMIGVGLFG